MWRVMTAIEPMTIKVLCPLDCDWVEFCGSRPACGDCGFGAGFQAKK
jgi:hypothetical protein